jgi:hypothetical protein
MKKQTAGMMDHRKSPHPDHETIQNLRCWVLLNYIIGKEISTSPRARTKTRVKRKSA